jgi:hypothetical protein
MARSLQRCIGIAVAMAACLLTASSHAAPSVEPVSAVQRPETGLPVDVALVIAVDVSLSMDPGEQLLQRSGYVEAFRHPDLIAAITNGLFQRIVVAYFEWGSAVDQTLVLPWTMVEDTASAVAVAARLEAEPIQRSRSTSISAALDFGLALLDQHGMEAMRHVIDVSGDGPNNDGRAVLDARAMALAEGVTINGLPVMLRPMGFSPWSIPELDRYYSDCVIGGPGAFVLPVRNAADFKDAIRQKLLLEIAGSPAGVRPAATAAQAEPGTTDCLIGERLRRQMWQD